MTREPIRILRWTIPRRSFTHFMLNASCIMVGAVCVGAMRWAAHIESSYEPLFFWIGSGVLLCCLMAYRWLNPEPPST